MKPILIVGMTVVNLALISYTIAVLKQRRTGLLSKTVMTFLTAGVVFDIVATVCMIAGSSKGGLTLHGLIGYSSLLGMLTDTFISYRKVKFEGLNTKVSAKFTRNTTIAYVYWIAAYLTGALLVMIR